MQQLLSDAIFLKKWRLLHCLLWPFAIYFYLLLFYSLFYLSAFSGLYSYCTKGMVHLHIVTSLFHTPNFCVQGLLTFTFCLTGMIVGVVVGFVQWRLMVHFKDLPRTWIRMTTASWAVGGLCAYLLYQFCLYPFFSLQFRDLPELTVFAFVFIMIEVSSRVGRRWSFKA